ARAVAREARRPRLTLRIAPVAREVESGVTPRAARPGREEQRHAALGLPRQRLVLAIEHVAIEGRAAGDQRALEARDGLDQMLESHGRGIAGESGGELAGVSAIRRQLRAHRGLAALESELQLVQQRLEHLRLE